MSRYIISATFEMETINFLQKKVCKIKKFEESFSRFHNRILYPKLMKRSCILQVTITADRLCICFCSTNLNKMKCKKNMCDLNSRIRLVWHMDLILTYLETQWVPVHNHYSYAKIHSALLLISIIMHVPLPETLKTFITLMKWSVLSNESHRLL